MTNNRWEGFARENAEYYILVSKVDYRTVDGAAYFFDSGRREVQLVLEELGDDLATRGTALEIGCGIGRLALPMAEEFDRVIGVDVSPTMLAKLRVNAARVGAKNVIGFLADEEWDKQGPIDLVYSRIVFQHIEEWPVIEDYVRRTASCLGAVGVTSLHFDTRPKNLAYVTLRAAPDSLLPRPWRRGIRRVRRRSQDVRTLLDRHGLASIRELHPDTDAHVFIANRRDP